MEAKRKDSYDTETPDDCNIDKNETSLALRFFEIIVVIVLSWMIVSLGAWLLCIAPECELDFVSTLALLTYMALVCAMLPRGNR